MSVTFPEGTSGSTLDPGFERHVRRARAIAERRTPRCFASVRVAGAVADPAPEKNEDGASRPAVG
jgi:hypothetical protein